MQDPIQTEIAALNARLDAAERRAKLAERKGRARSILGAVALVAGLTISAAPQAAAQLGLTLESLSARVDKLRADLDVESKLRQGADARHTRLIVSESNSHLSLAATLAKRARALEAKTRFMSVEGTSTIFRGTNVFVQNGEGATATANALGNLVVGYNEESGPSGAVHTGSHNLVLGAYNNYSSYGGAVFGARNGISGPFATVLGGGYNVGGGPYSAVLGGGHNDAAGDTSAGAGGYGGVARGAFSSVGGGYGNTEDQYVGWRVSPSLKN